MLEIVDDRLVKIVAAEPQGFRVNHAAEADDRGFGNAAAEINKHGAARFGNVDACADGRGDRRIDDADGIPRARLANGVLYRAAFHFGDAARHANKHLRLIKRRGQLQAFEKIAHHKRGDFHFGDDALL